MADFTRIAQYFSAGLSTDVKLTSVEAGHIAYETDTRKRFITVDGTNYTEMQDLDALVLGAGSAVIGKVGIDQTTPGTTNAVRIKSGLVGAPFTGSAAIAANTAKIAPGAAFRLLRVEVHLNAAPTTSEILVIALDAGDGAAYDTVLAKQDLSAGSLTDYVAVFGPGYEYESDDVITAAWTNTDTKTYGLRFVYELI